MVYRLSKDNLDFPDPEEAEENGLLAIGGDLSTKRLLIAYANGIFPWYDEGYPILWWCPEKRYIIKPSEIHISHSMKKFMKKHETRIELNQDFARIMHRCREKREEEGSWITDEMEEAYNRLHNVGVAVSVEAFIDGQSAGGLYGVSIGKVFCGESMYTDIENGSKVALIHLAKLLEEKGFTAIDCQFHTDHLESMGGQYVTRQEYREMVKEGLLHY